MDRNVLLDRVSSWGAMTSKREAEGAISATVKALREALFDEEAAELAAELPPPFARILRSGGHVGKVRLDEFYQRVAHHERVASPIGLEHAQAACQALASLLSADAVTRVSRALPDLAQLFVVPDRETHPAILARQGRTLAEGHPGSDHPLSEARVDPTLPRRTPSR